MNKRIRELVLQANPASKEIYESDNWEYNCAVWCAKDLAKFAELIVGECVQVVNDMADPEDSERYFWAIQNASEKIKQHFGVEE